MFGGLAHFIKPPTVGPPPKDVPPPTPVRLPQYTPQLPASEREGTSDAHDVALPSLVRYLQTLHRPTELSESHFAALGVHVHADAPDEDILPDPSYLPSTSGWDGIDVDEACSRDHYFRKPLSNGELSPAAREYLDRRTELSIPNQAAFRSIRRIQPEPGKTQPRLGKSYEFFKQMESMAAFWDDTSLPPLPEQKDEQQGSSPTSPHRPHAHPIDSSLEQVGHAMIAAASESNTRSETESKSQTTSDRVTYRTAPGSQMPPEFRHAFISAFIKLVAYDFGCNVAAPRVEPRLYLTSSATQSTAHSGSSDRRCSYFPSGCVFLFRMPTTREAARAGVLEGPLAAVSARNTTSFDPEARPADARIDFGRELVAALVTAQHRRREGGTETRPGAGQWWTTQRRWGGGEGGPIGREVDGEAPASAADEAAEKDGEASKTSGSSSIGSSSSSGLPVRTSSGPPVNKRARKNHLSMYDRYRMVRPPASNWDPKLRYEAIGRPLRRSPQQQGGGGARYEDFDDVFVLSSLYHHLCILRVRVPEKLLGVLEGEGEGDGRRSWDRLEIWRSPWFDLFVPEERLRALRLLWGAMGYMMRKQEAL